MSGGGQKQMRGRMGRQVAQRKSLGGAAAELSADDLKRVEAQLAEMTDRLNALRRRKNDVERRLEQLGRDSHKLRAALDQAHQDEAVKTGFGCILTRNVFLIEKIKNLPVKSNF